jgi:Tfp pilus assembly protein PilF
VQERRWQEAEAVFRRLVVLAPGDADWHHDFGEVLRQLGKWADAEKMYRATLAIDSKHQVHARTRLRELLHKQKKWADVEKLEREDVRLAPGDARAKLRQGWALIQQRKWAEAEKVYLEVVALAPKNANGHNNLGWALAEQGKLAEAEKRFREAARLAPRDAWARTNLGEALQMQGKWAEAEKWHRRAIALDDRIGSAHANLGVVLQNQGKWADATASYRQALKVEPNNARARAGLTRARRLARLEPKLPDLLAGKYQPGSNDERLALALLCRSRHLYRAAAKQYADALAADPGLADDLKAARRHAAACCAALPGCGQGEDGAKLDEKEKGRLRDQARAWLQADLAAWAGLLRSGLASIRADLQAAMRRWQQAGELAGVRDRKALAALPESERKEWGQLWAEVERLRRAAGGK